MISAVVAGLYDPACRTDGTAGERVGGRRILGTLGLACAVATGLLIIVGAPAWAASATPVSGAATQALDTAIRASESEGSVHIVSHLTAGHRSATFVQNAGTQSGIQTVTIGNEKASVIVVGGAAYIRGNKAAVVTYFGFPKALGSRLANRWISMRSTDQGYSNVSAAVTVPSVLKQIQPTGSITMSPRLRRAGESVVRISGKISGGTSTVFVLATGTHVIVSSVSHVRSGTITATFSHWGEPVSLTAPANAIPIGSISAG